MDISEALNNFYQGLDNLYQTGRTGEIEAYIRKMMEANRGCCGGHGILFISCLNEMGSYYRGISRYEDSVRAFEEAGRDILGDMGQESVEYATNRCNLAGTARMMGDYDWALKLFTEAATIYNMVVGKESYYYSTVLNNLALLYLERKEYEKAIGSLTEALDRIRRMPGQKEEEAITLVNLAVASQKLFRIPEAEEYLYMAMRIYERLEHKGVHYAAALNMQGTLCMEKKDYSGAKEAFVKARDATFQYFGENDDFVRAIENIAFVEKAMKGVQA